MKYFLVVLLLAMTLGQAGAQESKKMENPVVVFKTSMGTFEAELLQDKAPITVKNFLDYVDAKFYDGTIFHRVISTFVIQGGGFTADMVKKETRPPIKNEADNGVKNLRGTLSMARTNDINSATSQFFISVKDNPPLDHKSASNFGYAVFGKVTKGMDVVDKIKAVKTETKGMYGDVPVTPVVIESVRRAQ